MAEPLALLLDDGVIDEVFTRLKTGKEAEIWLVRHAGEVVAAKVYKERNARNFKNNAAYMEGRRVRNTRTQRAMDKGSRFGQASAEQAWKAKESEALHKLHAAGLRVPKPVMFYEGVLLMEAVLDADGRPAPRLVEAAIPREKAAEWYADLRSQVVKMLACDLVHGDLSPYNVLLAWNGPTIIDFPQVVGAAHNSQAERFFERDLENLRRFFLQHEPGLATNAGDAREIWRAFVRRELTPDFVPTGRPPAPGQAHERRAERPHGHGERREWVPGREAPQRQGRPQGRPPRRDGPRPDGRSPQRQDAQPQRSGQQPHGHRHGSPQPAHDSQPPRHGGAPQPQRPGPPDRRGSGAGRQGQPGPQVTVVQRIPGVGAAAPRPQGGQPQGQQGHRHHGERHGQHGGGQGHRGGERHGHGGRGRGPSQKPR
ncbi:MAG TPA: RIO1 family regulatory kinase/ATPase [Anaeromyxobacteraceae bacterium]|nr:RIO1 family regulatory kinase/ATPase [Anaeromyxobacteraceae bacterium]